METKLYTFLKNRGFLIDQTIADIVEVAVKTLPGVKAFLLTGRPGTGKTTLTELIAEWLHAEYIYFLATPNVDEDALLYKFVPDEASKSGIKVAEGPVTQAVKKSRERRVVLVIDEFDKTRPSADALLLDLLQHGRVTLYLGGKEDVITANQNNLYVFLTSNGVREFSEPLMRRLIRVDFQLLDKKDVYELLLKHFVEPLARLLSEIYAATVAANLRKPATLQELMQLGRVIMAAPHIPLATLIRMFVVKYDDDWENFRWQVERLNELWREAVQHIQSQLERRGGAAEEQPTRTEEAKTYTFKALFADSTYAALAALGNGKFKVISVDGIPVVVAEEPLSIEEYLRIYEHVRDGFEAYIEDKVPLASYDIEELAKNADSVKTYDRYAVVIGKAGADGTAIVEEEVHIELPDAEFGDAVIKAYVKVAPTDRKRPPSPIIWQIQLMRRRLCFKRLRHTENVANTIADIVSRWSEAPIGLIIDSEAEMDNSDVEKIAGALAEKGVEVEKECSGGKYVRIAVRKMYNGKMQISCYK
jgi:MoxR-like ATPase